MLFAIGPLPPNHDGELCENLNANAHQTTTSAGSLSCVRSEVDDGDLPSRDYPNETRSLERHLELGVYPCAEAGRL